MSKFLWMGLFLFIGVLSAEAASLTLQLTNSSGDSVTAVTATPKSAAELSGENLLARPIPVGESATINLETTDEACIFDLSFTFASGKILNRPDTDLCQSDALIIE